MKLAEKGLKNNIKIIKTLQFHDFHLLRYLRCYHTTCHGVNKIYSQKTTKTRPIKKKTDLFLLIKSSCTCNSLLNFLFLHYFLILLWQQFYQFKDDLKYISEIYSCQIILLLFM